ncbi:hypothetical protein GS597_09350 [Synechococcales cyanobacterium C]|uniref:Uncharacterized protein n=1 Tax=Petrachloros mirabilis ULC683 TaxID=2781853 RepID=A0A8K1ZXH1_9CYAN|nr:hypothetical protein [Petrachloros mirabilis]NCJ06708.1 hypothetical protein [Petrachloros mirabilis ULC683]
MLKFILRGSIPLLCLGALAAPDLMVPAVEAGPPPWAPAHGRRVQRRGRQVRREYRYVYYPSQEVYYAPDDGTWFWLEQGSWRVGSRLPNWLQPSRSSGVTVVLDSDRPYNSHSYVIQRYGRHRRW